MLHKSCLQFMRQCSQPIPKNMLHMDVVMYSIPDPQGWRLLYGQRIRPHMDAAVPGPCRQRTVLQSAHRFLVCLVCLHGLRTPSVNSALKLPRELPSGTP